MRNKGIDAAARLERRAVGRNGWFRANRLSGIRGAPEMSDPISGSSQPTSTDAVTPPTTPSTNSQETPVAADTVRGKADDTERLIAWGIERFRLGYQYDLDGARDAADLHYQRAIDELEQLRSDRCSPITHEILGAIALRHGVRILGFRKYLAAEAAFLTAYRAFSTGMNCDSGVGRIREMARASAWLGLARRLQGDARRAMETYNRAIGYWRSVLLFEGDRELRSRALHSLATTLAGAAKALQLAGQNGQSELAMNESRLLLERLSKRSTVA